MVESPNSNLYEEAYERIRDMLLHGELRPGSRISGLDLAKQLRISRTPVREAIRRLAAEGLIKEVPGFGAFIRIPTRPELIELYDLRELLESYAAVEAAQRITQDELDQLENCCQQWRELTLQLKKLKGPGLIERLYNRWITIDEHYHRVLVAAARNRLLSKVIRDMRLLSRTLDLRRLDASPTITFRSAAWTYRHHASLVRALMRRDPEAARRWMSQQIQIGKRLHLAHFEAVGCQMLDSTRNEWIGSLVET
jgi:DNA-binding GntR family transcriptional regulator